MARLKPPFPRVDPRWLGLGLKAAWSFTEGAGTPRDALNGLVATLASSDWGSGAQGPVIVHDATTDRTELAANSSTQLLPTGNVTIILGSRKTDATNRDSGAFGVDTATAAEYCAVKLPAADGTVYWDYGGVTAGTTRLTAASLTFGDDAWGFTVGPRGMEIWQNGILRASNAANPTRTATSAAFKLGLYDSALGGDLAAYNCVYVFAGQLSQDDIALLTSDPSTLFLDQHAASRLIELLGVVGLNITRIAAYEVIRAGRALRANRTSVIQRAGLYSFTDQQYALETVDAVSYIYTDQQHALAAVDATTHIYTDQQHALSIYEPTHSFSDQLSGLNAYELSYGFTDQRQGLDAYTLSYGYTDQLQVLDAYTLSYGYTDGLQALNAYEEWQGFTDERHALDSFGAAQYGYTDGLSALNAFLVSYGYTDAQHALQAPTEELRGWTDQAYALETRALAFGYNDQRHALDAYTLSYGYQDGQYALNAWQALYGFLDTLHALDARTLAYGFSDFRNALDADAVFYTWVLNAATEAASRYEGGFNFNSLCEIDASRYLGASSAGIHELGGDTDAGTEIAAFVLSGLDDFKSDHQKRLTDAYIAAESDGALTLKVTADGVTDSYSLTESGALKNRKVPLGKGRKGRYWQLEIANQAGAGFTLDTVSVNAEVLSRRV